MTLTIENSVFAALSLSHWGRGRLAAKLLDKSVITSATADCALCAYLIGMNSKTVLV